MNIFRVEFTPPPGLSIIAATNFLWTRGQLLSAQIGQSVVVRFMNHSPPPDFKVGERYEGLVCRLKKTELWTDEEEKTRSFLYSENMTAGVCVEPQKFMPLKTVPTKVLIVIDRTLRLIALRYVAAGVQAKVQFKFKDLKKVSVADDFQTFHFHLMMCPKYYNLQEEAKSEQLWFANNLKSKLWKLGPSLLFQRADMLQEFVNRVVVFKVRLPKATPGYAHFVTQLRESGLTLSEDVVADVAVEEPRIATFHFLPSSLSFEVKYLLLCLMSLCYTTCYHLSYLFLIRLETYDEVRVKAALKKILQMRRPFETELIDVPTKFEEIYHKGDRIAMESDNPMVPRILVTPSTAYFTFPEHQVPNRVTRQFKTQRMQFLRVSFVSEHLSALISPSQYEVNRIKEQFLPRFRLLDRTYELLAFSSSQLRERSLWMFASGEVTRDQVVAWMGDFSSIKISAKQSSRMGLCLTNTDQYLKIHESVLTEIAEVEQSGYCFSDGAGTISKSLLEKVHVMVKSEMAWGSAIQIRIRGIKGVVNVDPSLQGDVLAYRKSMEKFKSGHLELEVINLASHRFGYLNRQFITLLSTLDVPDDVFLSLQKQAIEECIGILLEREELFKRASLISRSEFTTSVWMTIVKLLKHPYRFDQHSDKFLHVVARAIFDVEKTDIHERQRIQVEQSALLIGVLDEAGVLGPDEVFVSLTYQDQHGIVKPQIVGDVAICKNPCFHPGDFRKLQAVPQKPGLGHYKNVIVFPKVGTRPHPNEITGSDLDGDLFFVTWDLRLTNFQPVEPMAFPAPPPGEPQEVTLESISNFFLQYMTSDALGKVANTHLALATMSPRKAYDEKCLQLAKMHSTAVDFAKTGVPIDHNDIPPVERWPDFMKKKYKQEFDSSHTLLGKLWRESENIIVNPPELIPYELPESFGDIEGIHALYAEYKEELQGIMNIYNIGSEVEVLTGEIISFAKHFKNKNKYKRREETRHKLQLNVEGLVKKYGGKFAQMQGEHLATECLKVAYEEQGEVKFYGFPWVVAGGKLLELANS